MINWWLWPISWRTEFSFCHFTRNPHRQLMWMSWSTYRALSCNRFWHHHGTVCCVLKESSMCCSHQTQDCLMARSKFVCCHSNWLEQMLSHECPIVGWALRLQIPSWFMTQGASMCRIKVLTVTYFMKDEDQFSVSMKSLNLLCILVEGEVGARKMEKDTWQLLQC